MSKFNHLTEEEKKDKLNQWLSRKREEKYTLEAKLRYVQEENRIKKERREAEKQKAEEKYQEWLENLKKKEQADKEKKAEEERRFKWKDEQDKLKRKEQIMHMRENKKELVKVRPILTRKGKAFVNGKLCHFYDWSTSPDPSFVNKVPWQS